MFVQGMIETIQASCKESLDISVSFAISSEMVPWDRVAEKYAYLKQLLDYRIGSGAGMFLIDKNLYKNEIKNEDTSRIQQIQASLKKIGALETYFERGQSKEFSMLLNEIIIPLGDVESMHNNPALELYYSISLMFLSYINRWNLTEKLAFRTGLGKLTYIDNFESWEDAVSYLKKLAEIIFNIQDNEQKNRALDAINQIRGYVDENIHQELSLVKLADLVYFNPSYLSRLFKQVTGQNLSDYIIEAKIKRAKQMLEKSEIKVHEVADVIGYNNAQNFTRFFKKATNMTPQEYRDSYLTGKHMR